VATDEDMSIEERYQYLRRMQARYQQETRMTRQAVSAAKTRILKSRTR